MDDVVVNRLTRQVVTLPSLQDAMLLEGYAVQQGEMDDMVNYPLWEMQNEGIWSDNGPLRGPDIFSRRPFIMSVTVTGGDLSFQWPNRQGWFYALITWGDGSDSEFHKEAIPAHTFPAPGTYQVSITGNLPGPNFDGGGDRLKVVEIHQWGECIRDSWSNGLRGCSNLIVSATDPLAHATDISSMFQDCSLANPQAGNWDTSTVLDMDYAFMNATAFNQDLSGWCVSNIAVEPTDFATGSALQAQNFPVWGTCP